MSRQHTTVRWLVAYDISDRRHWAKVYKLLKSEGIPLQYSIFMLHTSPAKMGMLVGQLDKLIDKKTDDVRVYRIPDNAWMVSLGNSMLPDDVWLQA